MFDLILICFIIIQFVFLNNLNNYYILEDETIAELNKQTKPLKRKLSESYLGPVNEWKRKSRKNASNKQKENTKVYNNAYKENISNNNKSSYLKKKRIQFRNKP